MIAQNASQVNKVVGQLIAKAWMDNEFQQRFVANTVEVLREAGLMLDEAAKVVVVQNYGEMPGFRLAAAGGYEINLPPLSGDLGRERLYSATAKDGEQIAPTLCCCC
ncbi:MAG: hypothetical protein F6J93_14735 [Oscillatoria sp. SIO1A7]|nr:hypothetical protein [Oscillatoria sp. SIO1A7]